MPSFPLPNFNITCDVWSVHPDGSLDAVVHAALKCQLHENPDNQAHVLRVASADGPLIQPFYRNGGGVNYNAIEVPSGSGQYYNAALYYRVRAGFPTEYWAFYLEERETENDSVWPPTA